MRDLIFHDTPWTSTQQAWEIMHSFVAKQVGIGSELGEISNEPDDFNAFNCYLRMPHTQRLGFTQAYRNVGSGSSSRQGALISAIGEGIERYSDAVYDLQRVLWASFEELAERTVDPRLFLLFSAEQRQAPDFAFQHFDPQAQIGWVAGYSLVQQRKIWVPASFAFAPYCCQKPAERLKEGVSTGSAAGCTLEEAVLSGLYEVIERDAFMITWLKSLPAPRVPLSQFQQGWLSRLPRAVAQTSLEVILLDITTDIRIPSFVCYIVSQDDQQPYLACGAATNLDPYRAAEKAVVEALQTRKWAKALARQTPAGPDYSRPEHFREIRDFETRVQLYAAHDLRDQLAFCLKPQTTRAWDAIPRNGTATPWGDLQQCLTLLQDKAKDVIVVDLTPSDIEEIGAWVVRVLVPGLHPLAGAYRYRALGGERLQSVPQLLGYHVPADFINPLPHPFP